MQEIPPQILKISGGPAPGSPTPTLRGLRACGPSRGGCHLLSSSGCLLISLMQVSGWKLSKSANGQWAVAKDLWLGAMVLSWTILSFFLVRYQSTEYTCGLKYASCLSCLMGCRECKKMSEIGKWPEYGVVHKTQPCWHVVYPFQSQYGYI